MFNGKSFNEKFLLTRKYYDFTRVINCTCKLTCMCACMCMCDHMCLREQYVYWYTRSCLFTGSLVFQCFLPVSIRAQLKAVDKKVTCFQSRSFIATNLSLYVIIQSLPRFSNFAVQISLGRPFLGIRIMPQAAVFLDNNL